MRFCFISLVIILLGQSFAAGEEAVSLQEALAPGYQYHVSTRTNLSGTLSLPSEKNQGASTALTVTGNGEIEYDERVLTVGPTKAVEKTMRIYRRLEFQRKVGDRPQ